MQITCGVLTFLVSDGLEAPNIFRSDERLLHLVLKNLVENSIKFTPAGGTVKVVVTSRDRLVQLAVEDSGRGIPEADLEHVFDRFWRGPAVRNTAGSGVGLAVVQELVHAHNGQVTVASEEGRGSRFVVTIPSA